MVVTDSLKMNSENSTDTALVLTAPERIVIGTLLSAVAVTALFGNVLVILAFAFSKKLHNTTNYFVINLSVADLITSLNIPTNVVAITTPRILSSWMCSSCGFLSVVCIGCSVFTLASIAVNRLAVISGGRGWKLRNSFKHALVGCAITLTWGIPIVVATLPLIIGLGQFGYFPKYSSCTWIPHPNSGNYSLILAAAYYPIPMTIILSSYVKIFLHLRAIRRKVDRESSVSRPKALRRSHGPSRHRHHVQANVTKNMFYVVCVFFVCTTPYSASLVTPGSDVFVPYAAVILLCNSFINPVIYATKHPVFSKVMREIILCKFRKGRHAVIL